MVRTVEPLCLVGHVCDTDVSCQNDERNGEIEPWRRGDVGQTNFKNSKGCVENML